MQFTLPGRFFLTVRTATRLTALFISLVTVALWFFGGPNLGTTRINEVVRAVDTATGNETVSHETRFLPGIDFLAIGLILAAIVWASGRLMRPSPSAS